MRPNSVGDRQAASRPSFTCDILDASLTVVESPQVAPAPTNFAQPHTIRAGESVAHFALPHTAREGESARRRVGEKAGGEKLNRRKEIAAPDGPGE